MNVSDVPRSLQSWVSTIQTVVLTADVFQLFMKSLEKKVIQFINRRYFLFVKWSSREEKTRLPGTVILRSIQDSFGGCHTSRLWTKKAIKGCISVSGPWIQIYMLALGLLKYSPVSCSMRGATQEKMARILQHACCCLAQSLQSWVSTIHTVVLTGDVFQLFIKYYCDESRQ